MGIRGVGDAGFAVHSKVYLCIYKLAKAVRLSKGKPCQTDEKIGDIFRPFGELLLSSQLVASPPNKVDESTLF